MGNAQSERLYAYCKKGDVEKVTRLLDYEACDVNWKNPAKHSRSAIIVASKRGYVNIVKALLAKKASASQRDMFGWNALDYACRRGHNEVVDVLTNDPNWINYGRTTFINETSLHIACRFRHVSTAELLLQKGGSVFVNAKSIRRNTPLHYAVLVRDIQLVKLLLQHKAPARIKNTDSQTSLSLAHARHFTEAIELMNAAHAPLTTSKSVDNVDVIDPDDDDDELVTSSLTDAMKGINFPCSVRCVLSGPPETGKSVFMKRITGEIKNLSTHPLGPMRKVSVATPSQSVDISPEKIRRFISHSSDEDSDDEKDDHVTKSPRKPAPLTNPDDEFTGEQYHFSFVVDKVEPLNKTSRNLHIVDTNGQPEFHEILPLILQGPALHLVFFDITSNLTKEVPTDCEGGYKTSYTPIQMLHQLLSSYYDRSKQSKALLLATHIDLVSGNLETAKRLKDEELRKYFGNSDFVAKGFVVTDPSTDYLFFPIDNMKGDDAELKKIVQSFETVIDKHFPLVEIPFTWASFRNTLRQRYESTGICKYSECVKIAEECHIKASDVPKALNFIHNHLGTLLYYENVEGLNELVICNPDLLFSSIKDIISDACNNENIRKTGEIPAQMVNENSLQETDSPIDEWRILNLLKQYNILTKMSPSGDTYFVPSLLLPDTSIVSVSQKEIEKTQPLLIQFEGAYIPAGVFSALVVKLAQKWLLSNEGRFSNRVCFVSEQGTKIVLLSRMSHLEVRVVEDSPYLGICEAIENALSSVCIFSEKPNFSVGFYCRGSSPRPHFSELKKLNDVMMCSTFRNCSLYCKRDQLSSRQQTWFQPLVERDSKVAQRKPSRIESLVSKDEELRSLQKQCTLKHEEVEHMKRQLQSVREEMTSTLEMKDLEISKLHEIIKDKEQQISQLEVIADEMEPNPPQEIKRFCNSFFQNFSESIVKPIKAKVKTNMLGILFTLLLSVIICLSYSEKPPFKSSLAGVKVIASYNLLVAGGISNHLHWEEHGLKLAVPKDALPPGFVAEIIIQVSDSGPYVYPDTESWKPASAIYWISSSKDFKAPILLGVWHYVREVRNTSHLRFITAQENADNGRYVFRKVMGGHFSHDDTYGYIPLQHFSGFGVQATSESDGKYVGNLLRKVGNKWDRYSFLIYEERPNGLSQQSLNKAGYVGWIASPPVIVEFQSDSIVLNLNGNGTDGWTATATFPPATCYRNDLINGAIISNMQFYLTWRGDSSPSIQTITLPLTGAKRPQAISFIADPGPIEPEKRSIPPGERLFLHMSGVTGADILQFCILLEIPYSECVQIQSTSNDIEHQKIVLEQKWRERTSNTGTWQQFIRALALIMKCTKARELAETYGVQFEENDDAVTRCPKLYDNKNEL